MLRGFLVLLTFQLLGELIADISAVPVPGPIIGMLLLFITLRLRQQLFNRSPSASLSAASHYLIRHLTLLFLPAGVGIFFLPADIQSQWPALLGAMLGGTLLSMLFCSWLIQRLAQQGKALSGKALPEKAQKAQTQPEQQE